MNTAVEIIKKLALQPHPEGGFFKEVYRSEVSIPENSLPESFEGSRNYATAIYFLLTSENFSAFHKIKQDEIWHFYEGSPIRLIMISEDAEYSEIIIGRDFSKAQVPQFIVPKNFWFAAEVTEPESFSLAGCTVSPGFDFRDFTLAKRIELQEQFPQHSSVIQQFTRE